MGDDSTRTSRPPPSRRRRTTARRDRFHVEPRDEARSAFWYDFDHRHHLFGDSPGGIMAVTLYTDRRMIEHRVPERHPERPERLTAILRHLERTGYAASCPSGKVREATVEELHRVHPAAYLKSWRSSLVAAAARSRPTPGCRRARSRPPGWRRARRSRPSPRSSAVPTGAPSASFGRPATMPLPTHAMGFCLLSERRDRRRGSDRPARCEQDPDR